MWLILLLAKGEVQPRFLLSWYRQTQTERQTDRQTDRRTDRQTDVQTDRQEDGQTIGMIGLTDHSALYRPLPLPRPSHQFASVRRHGAERAVERRGRGGRNSPEHSATQRNTAEHRSTWSRHGWFRRYGASTRGERCRNAGSTHEFSLQKVIMKFIVESKSTVSHAYAE